LFLKISGYMFSTGVPEFFLLESYRLKRSPEDGLKELTFQRIVS